MFLVPQSSQFMFLIVPFAGKFLLLLYSHLGYIITIQPYLQFIFKNVPRKQCLTLKEKIKIITYLLLESV